MCEPGPSFSVADCHNGWKRAFLNLGCEVVDPNMGERWEFYAQSMRKRGRRYVKSLSNYDAMVMAAQGLEAATYQFWPDLIFITSCFFVPKRTLQLWRARGHKVVILHTESPYEDDGQLMRAPYANINLLNDPTNIERFAELAPTLYFPHSYDPEVHHPRPAKEDLASDFCFVGTGYPSRVDFLEQVDFGGITVALGGNWNRLPQGSPLRDAVVHPIDHCVDNAEAMELYASTKMSANVYRREAEKPEHEVGWAMGPREVELAACGVPYLTEPRGENREVLGFLPTFDGPEDFGEKLRWWLARPDARETIATRARAAIADRTFDNAAKRLLQALDAQSTPLAVTG
jgi:spore maturation protein CgeB